MKVNIGRYKKIGRNVNIKIDNHDVYSFDYTLAYIILPALLALKEEKSGVPGEFADVGGEKWDQQMCFDFYLETYDEAFEIAAKEWENVLDKIIWSFQEIVKGNYENEYYYGEAKYETVEIADETAYNPFTNTHEKIYQMVDKNPDDHWLDIDGLLLHRDRIQEGLELFGKYYRNLWT